MRQAFKVSIVGGRPVRRRLVLLIPDDNLTKSGD